MHISQSKTYWPYSKDTMVQLEAKTDEGKAVIERFGSFWTVKPKPKSLQEPMMSEVMEGWLYIRSMLLQYRFVHVLHDRHFDVVFINKDRVANNSSMQPLKGKTHAR